MIRLCFLLQFTKPGNGMQVAEAGEKKNSDTVAPPSKPAFQSPVARESEVVYHTAAAPQPATAPVSAPAAATPPPPMKKLTISFEDVDFIVIVQEQ